MTDLHSRIVSALQLASDRQPGWQGVLDCAHLADAVIAELGLREETVAFANGPLSGFKAGPYAGCTGNGVNRRYVTEWENDG